MSKAVETLKEKVNKDEASRVQQLYEATSGGTLLKNATNSLSYYDPSMLHHHHSHYSHHTRLSSFPYSYYPSGMPPHMGPPTTVASHVYLNGNPAVEDAYYDSNKMKRNKSASALLVSKIDE